MTLVVPSHISLPTLPTQQLDIAYNPAPASDPATPRAVLTHAAIDLVAAAVTIAPSLSPAIPAEKSEYCLSSKRKAIDDDPLDIPRIAKRVKSDDDVLFGPLVPDTTVLEVSPDADLVQTAIFEQALAAIFSCSSSQDVDPSPVTDHPEPSHASPSRTARSPLATSIITASSIESIEAPAPVARPLPRMPSPPRNRIVEPPLWKMACRMRVDQLISMHGGHAIRAAVAQEYRPPSPVAYSVDEPSVPRRLSPTIVDSSESKLELEIITPVSYPQSPDHCDKEETSISDAESDIDMSFDLDDDSDTDSDSEEDADIDILSAHESILDVPVTERIAVEDTDYPTPTSEAESDAASFLPPPITLPLPIAIPSALPSWPPRLPRLSSIRAYCLREYPQMPPRGTPAQNSPYARGSLLPTCCQFAMSRSSDGMPLL